MPDPVPAPERPLPLVRRRGPGRVLVGLYALFTLAAGARAGVQIATRYGHAPLAYTLSASSALVYALATVMMARTGRASFRVAVAACSVELAGVLGVGTLSLVAPGLFPDASVWSRYGSGYLFVPLVLPVAGLLWLRHVHRTSTRAEPPRGRTRTVLPRGGVPRG